MTSDSHDPKSLLAIKVNQWLDEWNSIKFDEKQHTRKPDPFFYLFSLSANDLKALSGIQKRSVKGGTPRSLDLGIQRRHEQERSDEISRFVKHGYPWSELSELKRKSGRFNDLRKPGWLPTAVVVNIVKKGFERPGQNVVEDDLLTIEETNSNNVIINLPRSYTGPEWKPTDEYPIEVIDGQHRLWAFENQINSGDFELPVVAFYGLDFSWQAYLFWTINVKPKRINTSLAFDLYPLLRTEDWLEKFEGPTVYRETRAQELVEALWSYPDSPWYHRINMLGDPGEGQVSQAAWIRSLLVTFIKPWEGKSINKIGGLYGAPVGKDDLVLPWSRAQQAAFLIAIWNELEKAIKINNEEWAVKLRAEQKQLQLPLIPEKDNAFISSHSLLNTDQGVRAVLHIANDIFYAQADILKLRRWELEQEGHTFNEESIRDASASLYHYPEIIESIKELSVLLARYDWRTSNADGLDENLRLGKSAFRGSGGYKELRRQLLLLISKSSSRLAQSARFVLDSLGYK